MADKSPENKENKKKKAGEREAPFTVIVNPK